ncbi:hypothetical protein SUGI_1181170 [Cryptomeria japonica]|nr:hypothetical protein SUGI_1181170 [Cryptomeria japonica]
MRHSHDDVRLSDVDAPCSLTICRENSEEVQSIALFGDEEATQDDSSKKEHVGVSTWHFRNVRHCEDSEFEQLEENLVTNYFSRMDTEGNYFVGEVQCNGRKCHHGGEANNGEFVASFFIGRIWPLLFVGWPQFLHSQGQWNHLPLYGQL